MPLYWADCLKSCLCHFIQPMFMFSWASLRFLTALRSYSITKGHQGNKYSRSHRGMLLIDLVSLLSCKPHLPRGGRTNSDLGPPKPVINQEIPPQTCL